MIADPFRLDGRGALVTGAGRGLGRAMAEALAAHGARVALVARSAAELDAAAAGIVAAGGGAVALTWDVSDRARLDDLAQAAWDAVGAVDIVVHAAGVARRAAALDVDGDLWDAVVGLNLTAPFFLSQAVACRQIAAGSGGSHILVGSVSTHIGLPGAVPYGATKSGVAGLVRGLATEWVGEGIRVNGLVPGYFRTALTEPTFADPDRSAWVHSRIPMGRTGQPEDLAGAVLFLASDASSYVTGQLIAVDGGFLAG